MRPIVGAVLLIALTASCTILSSEVTGPGPMTNTWGPDLATQGYTEHEFRLSGVASSYAPTGPLGVDGRWTVQRADTANYTTRLFVRQPADPAKFNGTVIVEWLNVSAGFDTDATFIQAHDELFRKGYAYVGVSAEAGGATRSGERRPLRRPQPPGRRLLLRHLHPGGASGARRQGRPPPRRAATARIIAAGESQSAARMVTYINAVNPLVHVFDGFFILSRLSSGPLP